jgi:hypothetical protein
MEVAELKYLVSHLGNDVHIQTVVIDRVEHLKEFFFLVQEQSLKGVFFHEL